MMDDIEAHKLARIISTADNGCTNCKAELGHVFALEKGLEWSEPYSDDYSHVYPVVSVRYDAALSDDSS